jgi:ribosome-binding factor A
MNHQNPSSRDIESLRADQSDEDGADPRTFFRPDRQRDKFDRKTMQLCSQVAESLRLVLSGDQGDEVLSELDVVSVKPAPDATQLMVVVTPRFAPGPDVATVYERLACESPRLRAEVSTAITRRRAPKLVFQYVPMPGGAGGSD